MKDLKSQIVDALVSLGDCSLAIANRLKEKGIKGKQQHCHTCPIATFLAQHPLCFGMGVYITELRIQVGRYTILFKDYPSLKPIRMFMFDFDDGEFPELVAS